ncbi:hypothetical protein R1sor_025703 [Riccia sorocarpa]|uniref:Uncharacterized protein n=1 Tax=Riccia sorocarpa TaxID=122646 RepID=A0ABD3GCE4_9MARC
MQAQQRAHPAQKQNLVGLDLGRGKSPADNIPRDSSGESQAQANGGFTDADAVLLLHKNLKVVQSGVSGHGYAAWAVIRTVVGKIEIISIHAPRARLERARIALQENTTEGNTTKFEGALRLARRREQMDTKITRTRSRIKCLQEGDAPSLSFDFSPAVGSTPAFDSARYESTFELPLVLFLLLSPVLGLRLTPAFRNQPMD